MQAGNGVFAKITFAVPSDATDSEKVITAFREDVTQVLSREGNLYDFFVLPSVKQDRDSDELVKWVEGEGNDLLVDYTAKLNRDPYWYPAAVCVERLRRLLEEATLMIEQKIAYDEKHRERFERFLFGTAGAFSVSELSEIQHRDGWLTFEVAGNTRGKMPDGFINMLSVLYPGILMEIRSMAVGRRCPGYLAVLAGYRLRELADMGQHLPLDAFWKQEAFSLVERAVSRYSRTQVDLPEERSRIAIQAWENVFRLGPLVPRSAMPEVWIVALKRSEWRTQADELARFVNLQGLLSPVDFPMDVLDNIIGRSHHEVISEMIEAVANRGKRGRKDRPSIDMDMGTVPSPRSPRP